MTTNFKAGDTVECLEDHYNQFTKGKTYTVFCVDSVANLLYLKKDDTGRTNGWYMKFFKPSAPAQANIQAKGSFQAGDRVKVYATDPFKATVTRLEGRLLQILADGATIPYLVHPKQCRKLKPKKEVSLVEGWVNVYNDGTVGSIWNTKENAKKQSTDGVAKTVFVREVKK